MPVSEVGSLHIELTSSWHTVCICQGERFHSVVQRTGHTDILNEAGNQCEQCENEPGLTWIIGSESLRFCELVWQNPLTKTNVENVSANHRHIESLHFFMLQC